MTLRDELAAQIEGDVVDDDATLRAMSRDTSLFEKKPSVVVYPKHAKDVARIVQIAHELRAKGLSVSVTARAAGTCMSGGSLTSSILLVSTRYLTHVEVGDHTALTEPGVYYRDFEKATLTKNLLLPSYPASRAIAAMGGIIANNSGGERSLEYGKTARYVEELDVVLSDGTMTTFRALSTSEVAHKQKLPGREGAIYRGMNQLLSKHSALISARRPRVSKNSAGYALWDIVDEKTGTMNLAKLIVGSQGTLALWTRAKLTLVRPEPFRSMLIIFLSDLNQLPTIVRQVLAHNPESFESYDEHTFTLALQFLPQMLAQMGLARALSLGVSFLPEAWLATIGGVPKLVLMAEFSENTQEAALAAASAARDALAPLNLPTRIAGTAAAAEKYWLVRRESFALLRKNLRGLYAAPFIDDFVVPPDSYPSFLPALYALLKEYNLLYTIAGHIGNGNFHIIPLMDLKNPNTKKTVLALSPKVYDLVLQHGGTTTGEHNDGIIRTPYLTQQFGKEMVALFEETKRIFDPDTLFNPGKKVGGTFADIERYMRTDG